MYDALASSIVACNVWPFFCCNRLDLVPHSYQVFQKLSMSLLVDSVAVSISI
jgi:hypothetical protein